MKYMAVLMIVEMLCINLYISHICLERKASPVIVVPVMAAFTLLILGVCTVTISSLPEYGQGLFLAFGFLYLIPIVILYRCSVKITVSVMCMAWAYTMLVFLFSRSLGRFLPEPQQAAVALAVQTAAYLLTLRPFLRQLHEKLLYVVAHAEPNRSNLFFRLSVSTCAVIFCVNWVLLKEDVLPAKLALVCALAVNTGLMYQALYDLARVRRDAFQTRQQSLTDALTGLNNRRAFFEQAELLMEGEQPFSIVFVDLDKFKSVNDTYGHAAGDWYLKSFAREFTRQFSAQGELYRIAGDEFVFLHTGESRADALLEKIHSRPIRFPDAEIPFLGYSCGAAAFPADAGALDELLSVADQRMYLEKMRTKAAAKDTV